MEMLFSPRGLAGWTGQWSGEGRMCYRSCQVNTEGTKNTKLNRFAAVNKQMSGMTHNSSTWTQNYQIIGMYGSCDLFSLSGFYSAETQQQFSHQKLFVFRFYFLHRHFETTIIKLSQRSVSNLTHSSLTVKEESRGSARHSRLTIYKCLSPA